MPRIVAARAWLVQAQFVQPYKLSKAYGTLSVARAVVLELTAADGIVGFGEANPMVPFTVESPESALSALRETLLPLLFESGPCSPGAADELLDAQVDGHLCAKGAISMALLDLTAKRMGVPASALLGGPLRTSLPVLWPLGSGDPDEDARIVDAQLAQGYSSFMVKAGAQAVGEDIARIRALRKRYAQRIKLIADANQGWTREEAGLFLDQTRASGLLMVEQPLAKDDIEGLRQLRARGTVPISVDESLGSVEDALVLLRAQACDVFSLKVSKNGGPWRSLRLAMLARAFGVRVYLNSMLEFGITQAALLQLGCSLPGLVDAGHALMSTLRLREDMTDFSDCVQRGVATLPARPGLGVGVDEQRLERMAQSRFALAAASPR